jgi:hypothetical protein
METAWFGFFSHLSFNLQHKIFGLSVLVIDADIGEPTLKSNLSYWQSRGFPY